MHPATHPASPRVRAVAVAAAGLALHGLHLLAGLALGVWFGRRLHVHRPVDAAAMLVLAAGAGALAGSVARRFRRRVVWGRWPRTGVTGPCPERRRAAASGSPASRGRNRT